MFGLFKDIINRAKMQTCGWEKIFSIHKTDKNTFPPKTKQKVNQKKKTSDKGLIT